MPGPPAKTYGYGFEFDYVSIDVAPDSTLTNCQMRVGLASRVSDLKQIDGWNLCTSATVSSVQTVGASRGPNYMLLQRGVCRSGASTIVFKKPMAFGVMTNLYTFNAADLWDFWGGCNVLVTWSVDTRGSGVSGAQTPPINYSPRPDGSLVRASSQPGVAYAIYGGAKFRIPDPATAAAMGVNLASARLETTTAVNAIPFEPADMTLLREVSRPEIFVMIGGARYHIPSPAAFTAMGFDWGNVRLVPDGSTRAFQRLSYEGALIKELSSDPVYVVRNRALSHISSPTRFDELCFSWRNLRTAPDGGLAQWPRGPTL
jgi:hypothetical protein